MNKKTLIILFFFSLLLTGCTRYVVLKNDDLGISNIAKQESINEENNFLTSTQEKIIEQIRNCGVSQVDIPDDLTILDSWTHFDEALQDNAQTVHVTLGDVSSPNTTVEIECEDYDFSGDGTEYLGLGFSRKDYEQIENIGKGYTLMTLNKNQTAISNKVLFKEEIKSSSFLGEEGLFSGSSYMIKTYVFLLENSVLVISFVKNSNENDGVLTQEHIADFKDMNKSERRMFDQNYPYFREELKVYRYVDKIAASIRFK